MRKKELVHVHALLEEVRRQIRSGGPVPPDAYDAYEAYGLSSAAVHYPKADHREAVFRLADGVVTTIDERETEDSPADADSMVSP